MGAIQDGVLDHGGHAIGVMPKMLDEKKSLVKSERTYSCRFNAWTQTKMAELADAFVMAPGGAGSLEEFFETYSWAQIGIHEKPIAVYNLNGFFNPLQQLINSMIEEGFIDEKYKHLAPLYNSKEDLINGLLNFKPLGIRTYD